MSNRRRRARPPMPAPLEVWRCPISGDVHALVLVDVEWLPSVEGAERPADGGRDLAGVRP